MKLDFGATQIGDPNATKVDPSRELLRNKAGIGYGFKWTYQIEASFKCSGQADCKAKMDAVEAALQLQDQDLVFRNDDGSASTNSVVSAATLSGVRCTRLRWDPQPGGQFVTWRQLSATFEWETSIVPAAVVTAATWSSSGGGTATVTTAAAHGFANGQTVTVTAVNPAGYNATAVATVTSPTTFTYPLAANPGAYVGRGLALASVFLIDFQETVTIDNPPSRFVVTEAVNGVAPIARTTVQYPKSTAAQFGFAVGYLAYPDLATVAPPLWATTPPLKARPRTRQNPLKVGQSGQKEYRVEWRYEYESPTPLVALPPHTW